MYYLLLIPVLYWMYTKYEFKFKFKLMYISLRIICEMLYISLCQRLNKSVKRIGKNQYEISYSIQGKVYKIRSKILRGPSQILQIIDENSDDITHQIVPYIGPNYDFHKSVYTPSDFSKKQLIFNLSSGQTKIFNESENISIC